MAEIQKLFYVKNEKFYCIGKVIIILKATKYAHIQFFHGVQYVSVPTTMLARV